MNNHFYTVGAIRHVFKSTFFKRVFLCASDIGKVKITCADDTYSNAGSQGNGAHGLIGAGYTLPVHQGFFMLY